MPTQPQRLGPSTCTVDDCGKPSVGRGMCRRHYGRWWRHGDPTIVKPKVGPKKYDGCAVEGCGGPHLAKGFCKKHYRRSEKYGDPLYEWSHPRGAAHPSWKSDDIGYNLAHSRVRQAKGRATSHLCVDCGGRADEWSYIGGDPDERVEIDRRGKRMPYSIRPAYYAPRCHSCHGIFDKRRE